MDIAKGSALALVVGALLSGCAVLEPSILSSDTLVSSDSAGIRVEALEELTGERRDQYRASNYGIYPICAQVVFMGSFYAGGGYSMGSIFKVQPNSTADVGYVDHPAEYEVEGRTWSPRPDGSCGSYPG